MEELVTMRKILVWDLGPSLLSAQPQREPKQWIEIKTSFISAVQLFQTLQLQREYISISAPAELLLAVLAGPHSSLQKFAGETWRKTDNNSGGKMQQFEVKLVLRLVLILQQSPLNVFSWAFSSNTCKLWCTVKGLMSYHVWSNLSANWIQVNWAKLKAILSFFALISVGHLIYIFFFQKWGMHRVLSTSQELIRIWLNMFLFLPIGDPLQFWSDIIFRSLPDMPHLYALGCGLAEDILLECGCCCYRCHCRGCYHCCCFCCCCCCLPLLISQPTPGRIIHRSGEGRASPGSANSCSHCGSLSS